MVNGLPKGSGSSAIEMRMWSRVLSGDNGRAEDVSAIRLLENREWEAQFQDIQEGG